MVHSLNDNRLANGHTTLYCGNHIRLASSQQQQLEELIISDEITDVDYVIHECAVGVVLFTLV